MSVDGFELSNVYLHLKDNVLFDLFGLIGGDEGLGACVWAEGFFREVGTYSIELLLFSSGPESKVYLLQPGVGL